MTNDVLAEVVKWALAGHITGAGVTVEAGRAIRAAANGVGEVPADHKLVPIEPTEGMLVWLCDGGLGNLSDEDRQRHLRKAQARYKAMLVTAPDGVAVGATPKLSVWFGPMPESNGKTNWTAILHRGDMTEGFTIERSEHHDRVRYEADRVRHLIGELAEAPDILTYDSNMLSPEGWTHPCGVKEVDRG